MKTIYKTGLLLLGLFMAMALWNCAEADPEFVHYKNTISQMTCQAAHTAGEFLGDIYEFDADGNLITSAFLQKDVEGGYGLILFPIPLAMQDDINLSSVYLKATLTYDEFITPPLSGKHDITGDGVVITVKSGIGTTRQYRVRGFYE